MIAWLKGLGKDGTLSLARFSSLLFSSTAAEGDLGIIIDNLSSQKMQ